MLGRVILGGIVVDGEGFKPVLSCLERAIAKTICER